MDADTTGVEVGRGVGDPEKAGQSTAEHSHDRDHDHPHHSTIMLITLTQAARHHAATVVQSSAEAETPIALACNDDDNDDDDDRHRNYYFLNKFMRDLEDFIQKLYIIHEMESEVVNTYTRRLRRHSLRRPRSKVRLQNRQRAHRQTGMHI